MSHSISRFVDNHPILCLEYTLVIINGITA